MTLQAGKVISTPRIIPRPEHPISRSAINNSALKVLYRLKDGGYQAYLVGGCVRDLLLGREPKDFDVATDAHPDEVQALFRNCRLVGRRFRLAHIRFGREIIEVATFRAQHAGDAEGGELEDGRIIRDNVFGTIEDDALRRDFSVNALYYDIRDFSIIDYAGGLEDLDAGILRLIGDPAARYREDPVRMLRAVRFAVKLGFRIEEASEQPLIELASLLADIAPARLYDEMLKLFLSGYALQTFEALRHYGLFAHLFPQTERELGHEAEGFPLMLLSQALANTDRRVDEGKPVMPGFLCAALLWEPVRKCFQEIEASGRARGLMAMQLAADEVFKAQCRHVAIPRRVSLQSREIWSLQLRLLRTRGKRPLLLLENPRFRAGYDFMLLRAAAGEQELQPLCDWWTRIQTASDEERQEMIRGEGPSGSRAAPPSRPRRSRRRRRGRTSAGNSDAG